MRENGFEFVRNVKHGSVWSDGKSRITVSRSTRHAHEFKKEVDKAVELRTKTEKPVARLGDLPGFKTLASPTSHLLDNKRTIVVPVTAVQGKPAEAPANPSRPGPGRRIPRHDPETRYLIFLRIQELLNQGGTPSSITKVLQEERVQAAGGGLVGYEYVRLAVKDIQAGHMMKDPTAPETPTPAPTPVAPTPTRVAAVVAAAAATPFVAPVVPAPAAPKKAGLPAFSTTILAEATLSPDQRLTMLRTYASMVEHSPLVTAILTDTTLTAAQCFRMLEAYSGL